MIYICMWIAIILFTAIRFYRKRKYNKISDIISYIFYYYILFGIILSIKINGRYIIFENIWYGLLILVLASALLMLVPFLYGRIRNRYPDCRALVYLSDIHEMTVGQFTLFFLLAEAFYYLSDRDIKGYIIVFGVSYFMNTIFRLCLFFKKDSIREFTTLLNITAMYVMPIALAIYGYAEYKEHIFTVLVFMAGVYLLNLLLYAFNAFATKEGSVFWIFFTDTRLISRDKISLKKMAAKFSLALVAWILLVFEFLMENTIEFYYVNMDSLPFCLGDFYGKCIRLFFIISFILIIYGLTIKTKVLRYVSGIIFGIAFAGYLQVMIFNKDIGITDLANINWKDYQAKMIINSLIWIAVIVVVLILIKKYQNKMMRVITGISAVILIVQISAVISMFIKIGGFHNEPGISPVGYYLSGNDEYELSSEKNVAVFILDTYSNDYLDSMLQKYPDELDNFKDFTYFNNYDCKYDGTALAMNYILSGVDFDNTIPCREYAEQAFQSDKTNAFYKILNDAGYTCRIYTDMTTLSFISGNNLYGKYENVKHDDTVLVEKDYAGIVKNICKGSAYRLLPLSVKRYSIVFTTDFLQLVTCNAYDDDIQLDDDFKADRLRLADNSGLFCIYHFLGMHTFKTGEKEDMAKRNLDYVSSYIDKLEELGIYDDTVIIIMADHGIPCTTDGMQPIFFIKRAGEEHDKIVINDAPVSVEEFIPTVVYAIGEDNSGFGKTVYDYASDDVRERTVYVRRWTDRINALSEDVNYSFRYLYKYTYTGNKEDLRQFGEDDYIEKIELTDFWH